MSEQMKRWQPLCQQLIAQHLLTLEQIEQYILLGVAQGVSFIEWLWQQKKIATDLFIEILTQTYELSFVDLNDIDRESLPLHLFKPEFLLKHAILPLTANAMVLQVAVSDPTQRDLFNEIKFLTGLHVQLVLAEPDILVAVKTQCLRKQQDEQTILALLSDIPADTANDLAYLTDSPLVRLLDDILQTAIIKNASDIHFEPYVEYYRIRQRIDGVLYSVKMFPIALNKKIAARLKVIAGLDVTECRLPQDGRIAFQLNERRSIDLRISTCPVLQGEKIVIRILDPNKQILRMEHLGLSLRQQATLTHYLQKSKGMLLVTGPTGSGKTVTLYTALQLLNVVSHNLISIEDPIEVNLTGINQIAIQRKIGLDFPQVLRSVLRQDPDVIMIGEIRDLATAEIAFRAAQTGHLVLATLHTNNTVEAMSRLYSLGIPLDLMASNINLVIAQRLIRRICRFCITNTVTEANCNHCHQGYAGRIGVYELLELSTKIKELILQGAHAMTLMQTAQQEGMQTLYEAGLDKVRSGISSLTEVQRVIDNDTT